MLFPNEGWEAGICPESGGWVHTGDYSLCSRTNQPRTGLYALRGYTASGATRWGRYRWTITDPTELAALAGREITFKAWTWCKLISGGADVDNRRRIEVGDNLGSTTVDIPRTPYETYQQISVSHTIGPAPTEVFFDIYYYKAGAEAIYEVNIDDMESDPVTHLVLPSVTTNPATSVESASATLNGILDADGYEACDCGFEWGETIAYGNTTPTESKTTGEALSQDIEGLLPNTTYHFRAFATNSQGTSYGSDQTFTTPVGLPSLTTEAASAIGLNGATLNGALTSDGGEPCYCGFEWGETIPYSTTTPTQRKETGEVFSQPILNLGEAAQYHFRAFATNSAGTRYGEDRTIDTLFRTNKAYALARYEV